MSIRQKWVKRGMGSGAETIGHGIGEILGGFVVAKWAKMVR